MVITGELFTVHPAFNWIKISQSNASITAEQLENTLVKFWTFWTFFLWAHISTISTMWVTTSISGCTFLHLNLDNQNYLRIKRRQQRILFSSALQIQGHEYKKFLLNCLILERIGLIFWLLMAKWIFHLQQFLSSCF